MDKLFRKRYIVVSSFVFVFACLLFFLSPLFSQAKDTEDYSLYERASVVMKSFSSAIAPKDSASEDMGSDLLKASAGSTKSILPGQAGGLVGYTDVKSDDEGLIQGWIQSAFSNNSATFSYTQLNKIVIPNDGDTEVTSRAVLLYASYGLALRNLGLDSNYQSNTIGSAGAWLFGFCMQCVYYLASFAPVIFNIAITILKALNPFQLFGFLIDAANVTNFPVLKQAAAYISSIYQLVQGLSLGVIVPMMIGIMLFNIFLFRKGKAGKSILRVVFKIFLIIGGLPLIGATYTALLNDLADSDGRSASYADYIVLSSFVDFENWAKNTRLAPPPDAIHANISDPNNIRVTSPLNQRELVMQVNYLATGNSTIKMLLQQNGSNNVWDSVLNTPSAPTVGPSVPGAVTPENTRQLAVDMLKRYMSGNVYSSSDYEGFVKASIMSDLNKSDEKSDAMVDVSKMFSLSAKKMDKASGLLGNGGYNYVKGKDDKDGEGGGDDTLYKSTIYNAGSLAWSNGVYSYAGDGQPPQAPIAPISEGDGARINAGLTPLAMYNYLNSSFADNSVTVYSPNKSSNGATKESHRSVVFSSRGGGFLGFLSGIEAFIVMFSLGALALWFSYGMINVGLRSIPDIISGAFGTTVGNMAMIGKLLIAVIALVIDILGTILMYGLIENMMVALLMNMDNLIPDSLFNSISGTLIDIVLKILSISLVLLFLIFGMRNRTKFSKVINEAAKTTIEKFLQVFDSQLNEGNPYHNAAVLGGGSNLSGGQGASGQNQDNKGIAGKLRASQDEVDQMDMMRQASGQAPMSKAERAKNVADRMQRKVAAENKDKMRDSLGMRSKHEALEQKRSQMEMRAMEQAAMGGMNQSMQEDSSFVNTPMTPEQLELENPGFEGSFDDSSHDVSGSEVSSEGVAHMTDTYQASADQNQAKGVVDSMETTSNSANMTSAQSDVQSSDAQGSVVNANASTNRLNAVQGSKNGQSQGAATTKQSSGAKSAQASQSLQQRLRSNDPNVRAAARAESANQLKSGIKSQGSKIKSVAKDAMAKPMTPVKDAVKSVSKDSVKGAAVGAVKGLYTQGFGGAVAGAIGGYAQGTMDKAHREAAQNVPVSDNTGANLQGMDKRSLIQAASNLQEKHGVANYTDFQNKLSMYDTGVKNAQNDLTAFEAKARELKTNPSNTARNKSLQASYQAKIQEARERLSDYKEQKSDLLKQAPVIMQKDGMPSSVTNTSFRGNALVAQKALQQLAQAQFERTKLTATGRPLNAEQKAKAQGYAKKAAQLSGQLQSQGFKPELLADHNKTKRVANIFKQESDAYLTGKMKRK